MADLEKIRQENPEYKGLSDKAVMDRLYTDHYSDMPRDQYNAKIGYDQATDTPPVAPPSDENDEDKPVIKSAMESAAEFGKSAVTGAVGTLADFARGEQIESEQRASVFAPPEKINAGPVVPTGENLTKAFGLHNPEGFWGEAGQLGGQFAINPMTYFGPGSAVAKFMMTAGAVFGGAAGKQTGLPGGELGGLIAGGASWPAIVKSWSPVFINEAKAAAASFLNSEGVKTITASQRTGNEATGYWESIFGNAPGAGAKLSRYLEAQGKDFTAAVLRRAGIDAEQSGYWINPQKVIDERFKDIGKALDDIAANSSARIDGQFALDAMDVEQEYNYATTDSNRKPYIEKIVNDYLNLASTRGGSGVMTGEQLQSYRTDLLEKIRGAGDDSEYRQALSGLVDAFDNAISRQLPKEMQEQWSLLRRQYKSLLKIALASAGAGKQAAEGIITPQRLRQAVARTHREKLAYARGQGEFSALAHAGELVMTPLPNSGTSQRELARGFASGLGKIGGYLFGGGSGYLAGGVPGALAGGAAAGEIGRLAAPGAIGRATMSRPGQAYLGGTLRGQAAARAARENLPGKIPSIARSTIPALPQMIQDRMEDQGDEAQ